MVELARFKSKMAFELWFLRPLIASQKNCLTKRAATVLDVKVVAVFSELEKEFMRCGQNSGKVAGHAS